MSKTNLKKRLKRVLFGAMLMVSASAGAQDVGFSQFYANPLYLNPGFAGSMIAPLIAMT